MKIALTVTVDRMGTPAADALRIVREHLPDFLTWGGHTVKLTAVETSEVTLLDERSHSAKKEKHGDAVGVPDGSVRND